MKKNNNKKYCDKYNKKINQYLENDVFILFYMDISKCYYAKEALNLIKKSKVKYKGFLINRSPDELPNLINCLKTKINGHKTLPMIFYKGEFIGGYSDLKLILEN